MYEKIFAGNAEVVLNYVALVMCVVSICKDSRFVEVCGANVTDFK
jgi:hypothetical protein